MLRPACPRYLEVLRPAKWLSIVPVLGDSVGQRSKGLLRLESEKTDATGIDFKDGSD